MKDDFGYFKKDLFLCEGAHIVINKNINVNAGIYNGAKGKIIKMLFENKSLKYLVIELQKTLLKQN